MKFIRVVHTGYGLVVFTIIFLLLLPLLLIPIFFPKKFKLIGTINRWWAKALFAGVFLPFKIVYRAKPDRTKQYIFCANHFSYLDIPTMGLNDHPTIFVGKSEMATIPLFGYMYRKLHITVNRASLKSKINTLKLSREAIEAGKSLVIFPEGGIITAKDPIMGRFKDGAFRIAIDKQIPIVPVTIPYNWIILPPEEFLLRWHPLKIVFHEPVVTTGLTTDDLESLKEKVFTIINDELNDHLKNLKK
ncbi:MAG TPA: lysophospholipid acyltransferase family protein [Ohtaekwangia sp.]|nr:lysophospholipid acyltransferase family protein [Ohtaekwangia sp.]